MVNSVEGQDIRAADHKIKAVSLGLKSQIQRLIKLKHFFIKLSSGNLSFTVQYTKCRNVRYIFSMKVTGILLIKLTQRSNFFRTIKLKVIVQFPQQALHSSINISRILFLSEFILGCSCKFTTFLCVCRYSFCYLLIQMEGLLGIERELVIMVKV